MVQEGSSGHSTLSEQTHKMNKNKILNIKKKKKHLAFVKYLLFWVKY